MTHKNKKVPCVVCGKIIEPVDLGYFDSDDFSQNMWNGGTVDKLYMPYGSRLDGDIYVLGICDDCVEEKVEEKIIFKHA